MMNSRYVAVISLLLIASGCHYEGASSKEKETAFQPFASTTVGGTRLRQFLLLRTGALSDSHQELGSFTVISGDGYVLTAAHCLSLEGFSSCVGKPGGKILRLVCIAGNVSWSGKTNPKNPDFAILKEEDAQNVPHFEWAEEKVCFHPAIRGSPLRASYW